MMIAAVAFDFEDNPSPVYRERFICTREGAGDAQEFVDYYMGTTSSTAKPLSSLVVNNAPLCGVNGVAERGAHAEKSPVERISKGANTIFFEGK
jgi:hypothetical protein